MARSRETFDLPALPKGYVWVLAQCSLCSATAWWRERWFKRSPHTSGLDRTCYVCRQGYWKLRPVMPLDDRGEVPPATPGEEEER